MRKKPCHSFWPWLCNPAYYSSLLQKHQISWKHRPHLVSGGKRMFKWNIFTFVCFSGSTSLGLLRCQKKRRLKRRLLQAPQAPFKAPIHSKCCIIGFRDTGLTLVIVLRCDWPLCDLRFKSYEHFKIKMFLGEASYRPRTGLVQVPFTGAWKKGGASGAFFHLGALRCQQL